jgi:hypothetical protein
MAALGRLNETDFQDRILVDWNPLGTNPIDTVNPYLVGAVDSSIDFDAYLIVVGNDSHLYKYHGNDFVVVDSFDHASLKPTPVDRVDLGEIFIDTPMTLVTGVEITFPYEVPLPGIAYYFRIISYWQWLQEASA